MEIDESSCCDMPMEVLTEILIYLPVKSLIRFTCVCKSWLYLIKADPEFAMRHYLLRTTSSSSSTMVDSADYLVEYMGRDIYCGRISRSFMTLSLYSLSKEKTFYPVKKIEIGPDMGILVTNLCHGIMCVYVSASARRAKPKIILCNPAIREVVTLPASPNIADCYELPKFGFGFDSTTNDYKIVAVKSSSSMVVVHPAWLAVDVYSVRNGCWRGLSTNAMTPLVHIGLIGDPVLNANGRILNWLGSYKHSTNESKGFLSFDMVDEVFREVPLPRECLDRKNLREHHLLPTSRWMACLCCSSFSNVMDIWVLSGKSWGAKSDVGASYGEHLMWNKQVSVTFPDQEVVVSPLYYWMNDMELLVCVQKSTIKEVFHYDLGTQQLKQTGQQGKCGKPDGYTESLVSIKGFMSSYHGHADVANSNGGGGNNKNGHQPEKADDGSVYFIRQVGTQSSDCWSHSLNLV